MRVLVTRPEPGGKRTSERLAGLGHDPVQMPLFESRVTATAEDLPPVATIRGLIATSARAFAMFGQGDVSGSELCRVPVHVVGPATAQAARDAGFLRITEGGGTAEDLAALIAENAVEGRTADLPEASDDRGVQAYLAGVPRKPVIETALRASGTAYVVLECYKMAEISYSTDILKLRFFSPVPDAVLLYSANAARRLSALCNNHELGKTLDSVHFFCLSSAIAGELEQGWQSRVVVAEHPDEDCLLASMARLG
jgi:uroporphyrinogen-III synthase